MNKSFYIDHSALAESYVEQVNKQGFYVTAEQAEELKTLDKYRDQINNLWINNILSETEQEKALLRIQRRIKNILQFGVISNINCNVYK